MKDKIYDYLDRNLYKIVIRSLDVAIIVGLIDIIAMLILMNV